jgi:hypothetical protein
LPIADFRLPIAATQHAPLSIDNWQSAIGNDFIYHLTELKNSGSANNPMGGK